MSRRYAKKRRVLELLESRRLLTTYLVDTFADNNDGNITAGNFSLREAIIAANNNPGEDTIRLPDGTYNLTISGAGEDFTATGDLDITEALTIESISGNRSAVIVDGNALDRVFDFIDSVGSLTGQLLTLNNFTIRNGEADFGSALNSEGDLLLNNMLIADNVGTSVSFSPNITGAISAFGDVSITNSRFERNNSESLGGAIFSSDAVNISISNTTFIDNRSTFDGGAVYISALENTNINIDTVQFTTNTALDSGGALFIAGANSAGLTTNTDLIDVTFTGNAATFDGGAAFFDTTSITASGTAVRNNRSVTGGGGFFLFNSPTSISGSNFSNNLVSGDGTTFRQGGGAIVAISDESLGVPPTKLEITGSVILQNEGPGGGGIAAVDSELVTTNTVIEANIARGLGGGGIAVLTSVARPTEYLTITGGLIYLNTTPGDAAGIALVGASASIDSARIFDNTAQSRAGGIGITGQGLNPSLSITKSSITTNHAQSVAGGIGVENASLSIENSTISGNTDQASAGGIFWTGDSPLSASIAYSTIANNSLAINSSTGAANLLKLGNGTMSIDSTIIADAVGGLSIRSAGGIVSSGHNLDEADSGYLTALSDIRGVDPGLLPLALNNSTTLTHALAAGSPARDQGRPGGLPTDQRGIARIINGDGVGGGEPDIGAFEAEAAAPASIDLTVAMSDSPDPVNVNQSFTYTVVITNNSAVTATNVSAVTTLASQTTFVSAVVNSGTAFQSSGQVFINVPSIAAGQSVTASITVIANSVGVVSSSTSVTASQTDSNLANNIDTETTTIQAVSVYDVQIFQSASSTDLNNNEAFTIELTAFNAGPSTATNVVMSTTLPVGLIFDDSSPITGVSVTGQNITISVGSLAPNTSTSYTLFLIVSNTASGTLVNTATISTTPSDSNLTNNTSSVSLTISPDPNVARLTTGTGDGHVTIDVNPFGRFGTAAVGQALYDPFGLKSNGTPKALATTTFSSGVLMGINGTSRSFLSSNSASFSSTTPTTAVSSFTIGNLLFELAQEVTIITNSLGVHVGAQLTQNYQVRNIGASAANFDLVRYFDGDLFFDGTLLDGGGRLVTTFGEEVLFETDAGGTGATDTTFVGISSVGGDIPSSNRYEIDQYATLRNAMLSGTLPDQLITGDTNSDQFVDSGKEYDLALVLRNLYTLAPNATKSYTTRTVFGSGAPEDISGGTGTITGELSCDSNGNGTIESSEIISGATVYLDFNGNRTHEASEPITTTDADGRYVFLDVPTGSHAVVTDIPSGCRPTPDIFGYTRTALQVGSASRAIEAIDLDQDDNLEIVIANELSNDLSVLTATPNGYSVSSTISAGERPRAMAAGQDDIGAVIAVASVGSVQSQGEVRLIKFPQSATGVAAPTTEVLKMGNGPTEVALGDFNEDGLIDVVASTYRSGNILIKLSGVASPTEITSTRNPAALAVADLNNDENLDLIIGSSGFSGDTAGQILVYLGNGQGGFSTSFTFTANLGLVDLAIADVDRVAGSEIITATQSGVLTTYRLTTAATPTLEKLSEVTGRPGVTAIALGDLNADGRLDLVATSLNTQTIQLFMGDGTGTFTLANDVTGVTTPVDVVVADFDKNGTADVAAANYFGRGTPYRLPSEVTMLDLQLAEQKLRVISRQVARIDFSFLVAADIDIDDNDDTIETPRNALSFSPLDVDQDANISPRDALLVINQLARTSTSMVGESRSEILTSSQTRFDVNRDNRLTPLDALLIINRLNSVNNALIAAGEPDHKRNSGAIEAFDRFDEFFNQFWEL